MNNIIKIFAFLGVALLPSLTNGQNLIGSGAWTDGAPDTHDGYNLQGTPAQNSIETLTGPYGQNVAAWQALSDGVTGGYNGGWIYNDGVLLDTSKSYRFTLWIKSEGSSSCGKMVGYIPYDISGTRLTSTEIVGGGTETWPYFLDQDFADNTWYLLVAYLRPNTYSGSSAGGVYDISLVNPSNPSVPTSSYATVDFKFPPTASYAQVRLKLRAFMWTCSAGEKFLTYDPRVEEIGTETPLIDLLAPNATPNIAVTSITLSPSSLDLDINAMTNTSATVLPVDATEPGLNWSSGNTAIATVNSSGQVTAIGEGTTTITATSISNPSVSGQLSVTVTTSTGSGTIWSETGSVASYSGNVAVGTTTVPSGYNMAIDGKLVTEEVRVELSTNWPDYVFTDTYSLRSLEALEKYIEEKGHLPNIPDAATVAEEGIALGEMNRLLLEKIEELTVYILQQEQRIQTLEKTIDESLKKQRR